MSKQVSIKFSHPTLVRWLNKLEKQHISKSAAIREILLDHLSEGSIAKRLDRIEAMLKNGQGQEAKPAAIQMAFDDDILDSDL